MAEGDTSTTRMGRFRICPPNSPGPPGEQMSHGRFRIIPQGKIDTRTPPFDSMQRLYVCLRRILERIS